MVWKIRLICDDCNEKAILTPQKPKVIAKMVFNGRLGSELAIVDVLGLLETSAIGLFGCTAGWFMRIHLLKS